VKVVTKREQGKKGRPSKGHNEL